MTSFGNGGRRVRLDSLKVEGSEHPDWTAGTDRLPEVGEVVHCAEGAARVVKVLGKTGDGSRLLELVLVDGPKAAFFAAASNVLVAPPIGDAAEALGD